MASPRTDSKPPAASDFIAFIHDSGHQAWIVLAVESTLKKSAAAYATVCNTEKHFADVPIQMRRDDDRDITPFIAAVQVKHSRWSIIIELLGVPFGLREIRGGAESAQKLSAELKTRALMFYGEDTAFTMGAQVFANGEPAAVKTWESQIESPERFFAPLGVYLPACYPCSQGSNGWLAVAEPSLERVERADFFTSRALDLLVLRNKRLTPEAERVAQQLVRAADRGELEKARALLKSGAVLTSPALSKAVRKGRIEILKLLLAGRSSREIPFSPSILGIAVPREPRHTERQLQVMAMLIKAGAEVDEEREYGMTALLQAVKNNSAAAIKLLAGSGANVNRVLPTFKETPLHWAAERGYLECVKALIDAGAKVDAQNHRGRTPLKFAQAGKHKDVVTYLKQAEHELAG